MLQITRYGRRLGVLAALLLAVLAARATALPEDREQPIEITADKAVRNEKRGVTIYSGNVQLRQGSLELDADNLVVFHEGADTNKIIARGEPARMRQQPEPDEDLVHAFARVITYFRDLQQVNLQTEARVEREDGTLVTGDSIDYYIEKQLMTARADESNEGGQVFVVIPPELHDETAAQAGGPGALKVPATPANDAQPAGNQDTEEEPSGGTDSE